MDSTHAPDLGTCLVTGATGFIGSVLCSMLIERGVPLRALVRAGSNTSHLEAIDAQIAIGDILDPESLNAAMDGIDTIFHLAVSRHAIRGENASEGVEHRAGDRDVTVEGTRNVALAAAAQQVKRVVHASSAGVVGWHGYRPASEDTPTRPDRPYRVLRVEAEAAMREICQSQGLAATICRLTHVYGPGDLTMAPVYRLVSRGAFKLIGSGHQYHHLSFVEDVAGALIAAVGAADKNAPHFIVGSAPQRLRDYLEVVARVTRGSLHRVAWVDPVIRPASFLYHLAGRPLESRLPWVKNLEFHVEPRQYDLSKSRRQMKLPPDVPLEDAVQKTADWYRVHGLL